MVCLIMIMRLTLLMDCGLSIWAFLFVINNVSISDRGFTVSILMLELVLVLVLVLKR